MSVAGRLKKLAAAGFSVAAFSLSMTFNAGADPVQRSPLALSSVRAAAPVSSDRQALNQQLLGTLRGMSAYLSKERSGNYDLLADPVPHRTLDRVKALLAQGADPNYIDGKTRVSVFSWALWLAYEMDRPDVVESFLDRGANPRLAMPADAPVPKAEENARKIIDYDKTASGSGVGAGKKGITIMDHALTAMAESQSMYRAHIETAAQIVKMLKDKGALLKDSAVFSSTTADEAALARNLVGLSVLRDMGMVTAERFRQAQEGGAEIADAARAMKDIDDKALGALKASLVEFPDVPPGGPEPYTVEKGDTLGGIAYRFAVGMGVKDDREALRGIAERNGIGFDSEGKPSRVIKEGETLLIPVPKNVQIGWTGAVKKDTLMGVAKRVAPNYQRPGAPPREIALDLARMNGLDVKKYVDGKKTLEPGKKIWVPWKNDGFGHMPKLTPPQTYDRERKVRFFIVESANKEARSTGGYQHEKETFRSAVNTAYSLNPDVDFSRFFVLNDAVWQAYYMNPKEASKALRVLQHPANPSRDSVVFSSSMFQSTVSPVKESTMDGLRAGRRSDEVETVLPHLQRDFLEKASPIIFDAATNDNPDAGRYGQQISHLHSGRTVIVGAVGTYSAPNLPGGKGNRIISTYSVYGAQVCAVLPSSLGKQMEGTSFSTPDAASLYRQLSEWYGDRLSYEEIMAAGLMTADRNIFDYDNVSAAVKGKPGRVSPVLFRTNGAGMPVSDRCGAGMLDPVRWNETLKVMTALREQHGRSDSYHTNFVPAGDPAEIRTSADGKPKEYVYRIPLSRDMTLGKLTFYVGQERYRHSEVMVTAPSGFGVVLPKSPNDTITTVAFSYEDVKKGQFLEIRAGQPLGAQAGVMVRGHDAGNLIQVLREHLRAQGVMKPPLRAMKGDKVTGDLPPAVFPAAPEDHAKKAHGGKRPGHAPR